MKDLAVIVPAYNCADSLGDILEALVNQKTDDVEIIVVDDGSTDDTLCVAQRYEKQGVIVLHQENGGVGSARNAGMAQCAARYVWFVDADDGVAANALETIVSWIRRRPCDCYYFGFRKIDRNRIETITNPANSMLASSNDIALRFDDLFSENHLNSLWNKVFNVKVITENNITFSNMKAGEDAVYVLEFFMHASSMYVSTSVLYDYNLRSATSSGRKYNSNLLKEQAIMYKTLEDYCMKCNTDARRVKYEWFVRGIIGSCYNIYNDSCNLLDYSSKVKRNVSYMVRIFACLCNTSKANIYLKILLYATLAYCKRRLQK